MHNFPGNVLVWKLRNHVKPGQKIKLSIQHRFGGSKGELRYVVFESIWENFNPPNFVKNSKPIQVSHKNQWSNWSFTADHAVNFVGTHLENAGTSNLYTKKALG